MKFKNCRVYLDGGFSDTVLTVENGRFSLIGGDTADAADLGGRMIIPGFFDIHTHGALGYDFTYASPAELEKLQSYYYSHGVTSVLATVMTAPREALLGSAARLGLSNRRFIRGINMEGPFFCQKKRGAHDIRYLAAPDIELVDEMNRLSGGMMKIINIDPLTENAEQFIRAASERYTVSVGHTDCDFETAVKAFGCGANHVTHLFNACRAFSQREPGLIGAAAASDVYSEMICDMMHIHPAVVKLMFDAIPQKIVLISDSISAAGQPDGSYISGGMDVTLCNGRAALADGTIAGSVITLLDAVKRLTAIGVPASCAIHAATAAPADSVGMRGIGRILPGYAADFIICNDNFDICEVYKDGVPVFSAE